MHPAVNEKEFQEQKRLPTNVENKPNVQRIIALHEGEEVFTVPMRFFYCEM